MSDWIKVTRPVPLPYELTRPFWPAARQAVLPLQRSTPTPSRTTSVTGDLPRPSPGSTRIPLTADYGPNATSPTSVTITCSRPPCRFPPSPGGIDRGGQISPCPEADRQRPRAQFPSNSAREHVSQSASEARDVREWFERAVKSRAMVLARRLTANS